MAALLRALTIVSVALMGGLTVEGFTSASYAKNVKIIPIPRGPSTRPAPMRPRPSVGGFKGPAINKGPSISRPRPLPTRPGIGITRPSIKPGHSLRPIQVRPRPGRPYSGRPPNKYPQTPDFVDVMRPIDDITPTRPPGWRPPIHRPPHYRPPHGIWGDWYYYGGLGWYHRIQLRGATVVIVQGLPPGCRRQVRRAGERLYKCNGVYYRTQFLRGERVYEVVSKEGGTTASNTTLRLTKPFMRGTRVLNLQRALKRRGYNVGNPDGVFGRGTARALMAFQRDVGLTPDGVAGRSTLRALR